MRICAGNYASMRRERKRHMFCNHGKTQANKSLQATRDGGLSSAIAVHVIWSRVPELKR
jgi:hypothetical protein